MKKISTEGILLRKTNLASDDAVLEWFTPDLGRVTTFVSKLQRSKKKSLEIDFFRVVEIGYTQGRTGSCKLTECRSSKIFPKFSESYVATEMGFDWLSRLQKILPEDTECVDFYRKFVRICEEVAPAYIDIWDLYVRAQILVYLGGYPTDRHHMQYVSLSQGQYRALDFFGKAAPDDIIKYQEKFDKKVVQSISALIERYELNLSL